MYPDPSLTKVSVPTLQTALCGPSRPGHFEGVCLVVAKLLNLVGPDELYLGQKDAQQAIVLTRMVKDLCLPMKVRVGSTVREADGLAMSSRNAYLTAPERRWAPRIYEALQLARRLIEGGEDKAGKLTRRLRAHLADGPGRVDYVEVVDARTLAPITKIEDDVLIAAAVYVGKARLIDNVLVRRPSRQRSRRGIPQP
jgi:pantoate--beta-alanine ligase